MARRRLHVLAQPLDVEATIDRGDTENLVAAARVISDAVRERVRGRERAHGRSPSCREACAACCQQLVPISSVEAVHLGRVVDALPEPRRSAVKKRFDAAIRRLVDAKLLDRGSTSSMRAPAAKEGESAWDALSRRYRELAIACPLLEDRRCSVYADRPLVCREYEVSSPPASCAHPRSEGVVALPRPVRMSEVLADTLRALAPDPERTTSIPLVLALSWASAHSGELDAALQRDGATIAQTLLDMIDVEE